MSSDKQCTLLVHYDSELQFSKEQDYIEKLESKDDNVKIESLKCLIHDLLKGEQYPKLLMTVIKFCLHSENHNLKKLLLLYWEVVDKKTKDGHLLHEMILVCNAMKNNLTHPNEYIRGATLRFLCKIKEPEILESLIPSITANLEHRHSYVRKNAVLTVFHVYEAYAELIPDAPELIETFLYNESNPSAKRNAFLMLFHCDQERAINFLNSVMSTVGSLGESFQLVVLELIRKICRSNPLAKSQYIRCIFNLVNCPSHAVAFEGANTLVALSSAPTAVRAAITAYCNLLQNESDNNIKLIILQRLSLLKKRNEKILQEMLMDILRTLSSPNTEIRKKTLELTIDLLSPRNVEEVVQLLKKELVKTEAPDSPRVDSYRKLLMDAMHQCAVKFPDVVSTVVQLLMNYLGDENNSAAGDVATFVREIVHEYPTLRETIITKVLESFNDIRSPDVYRQSIWILGEYINEPANVELTLSTLRSCIGPLPFLVKLGGVAPPVAEEKEVRGHIHDVNKAKKPVVLADGTYASSAAVAVPVVEANKDSKSASNQSTLRSLLVNGDYMLGSVLANTFFKLTIRWVQIVGVGTPEANEEIAKSLLFMVSLLKYGQNPQAVKPIDPDSSQRISISIRLLLDIESGIEIYNSMNVKDVFKSMLEEQKKKSNKEVKPKEVEVVRQVDDLIVIRQLKGRNNADDDLLDDDESDISRALGGRNANKDISSKLNRVYQLTGFSDPVYVEAHLAVQDYDIVLDILVVNQTSTILQNLCVELHTSGDLKVVDRPQSFTIAPNATQRINATIKLTSTESGVIFGNVVYDNAAGNLKTIVVLNNIHMDVMDYISPATCSDVAFRSMWAEFEWENKVAINTDITDLLQYLEHVLSITNMKCMTPQNTMSGSANFLAANLYARSMFGEDALLNLSVEKQKNGKVSGYIRIRSKTQGIALSLGDKIQAKQRGLKA